MAELVAAKARALGESQGSTAAKAAKDIKGSSAQKAARITYGGKPFSMGAEFGSIAYRQFKGWKGSGPGSGYFLFPAVREARDETMTVYMAEVTKLTARAFPD